VSLDDKVKERGEVQGQGWRDGEHEGWHGVTRAVQGFPGVNLCMVVVNGVR
jgi:hypothetical protein